jgi:tetratricopeptide (TPR) repeat protein
MHLSRFSFGFIAIAIICPIATAAPAQTPANSGSSTPYQTGRIAMQKGDLSAARTAFEKAVRLNPQSADAQNMLGQVLLEQGELDAAIIHFRTLVRLRPKLAIAHAYLAQALQAKGLLDEAISQYRSAVDLAPQQWQARQALGRRSRLSCTTNSAPCWLSSRDSKRQKRNFEAR